MKEQLLHGELTQEIIHSFYQVYNILGHGFLEKVYENALALELLEYGFAVERQRKLNVYYKNKFVGKYYADLIVEKKVIIEVKAKSFILDEHENQLLNYLKATDIEVGLLLNFGTSASFRRKILTNDRK